MVAPGNDKTISVNELGLGLVPSEPGLDVIAYRHARSESPHVAVQKQRLVNTTIRTSRQRETYLHIVCLRFSSRTKHTHKYFILYDL